MDFTAEQVKNRHSISVGDTVIVSDDKSFKLINSTVTVELDGSSTVLLQLEWKVDDKTGIDTINSTQLKNWL